ncbi:phthiocerol/phenolphthiocerol synthesis type-I polyketide synthase D [Streptomyces spectabilis]|uniref:Phthiocerol/phenolphthiocerol synthesis type-I polyketide synthase D n=1 Tax=Streptomyces spectabilis TaxID=68270 RepID=A0A7W8B089_STRST|nr:phthiocerol/phenolphthiocerol synthesis type-I polyketide synthase D [Streptomyces spectabilis]MCI3899778.1 SDR family NAD(P)-dependent oxidoreductase [Streptomyces spectabilis]
METPEGLWQLAADGRQTVGPVPADRWDAQKLALLHDPELRERAAVGCFLDGDVWAWEPEALSVAPAEREWVDPQARVLMETAREAVEHAGLPVDQLRATRTGVYVGTYALDNLFREARPVEDAPNSPYLFGNYHAGPAGRVAFAMDLRGPVMVVGTHCSAGLVALDTACGALALGQCDAALAGGVLLMLAPQTHYFEAPLLLSRRGACHAFDARGDGYVRGEGAGMILLKRLTDAQRDGDRVLAVIRGSAVNNDGQATRLTAPSTEMQQELFREAVRRAGIDPGEVGLVEAHGPGTAVGDPIEYTSINAVYGKGRGRCALGSVKTNIGHCEPVSGIAGLIKTVECLRRGVIPPNQNFRSWNPGIDRDAGSRLFVPTELTEWPVDGVPRRAAVCSYGVSGTNAHVVLEQAPAPRRRRARKAARHAADGPRLFLLSADSAGALADSARRLAAWLEGPGAQADLGDVAHTLAMRRRHAEHRLGIVAADTVQLRARARAFAGEDETDGVASGVPLLAPGHPGPVFVFTGQGSQYPGMCRELLASEPAFAAAVDELEALIFAESGFSLRSMIEEPEGPVGVDRIQPALFGVQVALAELWRSWGLEPAAVIGQSLGEVAASVVAGVLSREDGAKVICRRAALLARIAHGAMASVLLSAEETRAALESAGADGVDLGVLTAPRTTVISGDAAQVRALVEHWNETGTVARMVDVNVASHSSQVDPVIDDLHAVLSELPDALPGDIRFYSTVSEDPRGPGPLNASYWVRNQRDTVHFQRAVTAALADGHRLFVECTAHPLAARPIHEIARQTGVDDVVTVGSLRRGAADQEAFLTHLATAHAAGCGALDLASRYGDGQLVDLPTTAWNRTRHGGTAAPYTLVAPHFPAAGQHPLLGGHVHDPDRPGRHLWQTPLGPRRLPWLADHKVAGLPVLPGTGFAEMILAAAEVLDAGPVLLTGLRIEAPLVLDPEPEVTTHLTVDGDQWRAEVLTRTADGTVIHAHAAVQALATSAPAPCPDAVHRPTGDWRDTAPAALYRHFRERHDVHHGPAFAAIDRIRLRPERGGALSAVRIADSARVSAAAMRLHPALADEFVQTAVAAWLDTCATSPGPVVVAGFDEIRIYGPTGHARHASVTLHHADDLTCTASGTLATDDGTVVAELRGLRLTNITPPEQRYTDRLAHLTWTPAPPPTLERTTAQQWLVVAPQDTLWSERLHLMLSKHAAGSHLLSWPCGRPLDPEQLTKTLDDDSRPSPSHVLLALNGEDTQAAADGGRAAVLRVLTVLRTLAARPTPPRLWVLCRADQPLAAAGVRGLLRTAAFEHPELKPSSLELSGSTALEAVLPDLLKEPTPVTEISWHHGARGLTQVRRGPGPRHPASPPSPLVRPDGGYLITGGLGGLGLLTARRFAERGACRLVLAGRSAPGPEAERALEELRTATGAAVEVVLGDIAEEDTVRRALAAARANGAMLRGIIHAAGVVEDATLTNLDTALLDRVWRGKAEGAWALHRATLGAELDHFVLYSSIASLIGSPGQGAYAAANAFLDALVTHRLALGLPATGIHWGAWSQVGRGQHLVDRGFVMINPGDGTDAFERILTEGHHQIAYSPIDAAVWTAPYPALRHSTLLAELLTDAPAAVDDTSPVRDAVLTTDNAAERHQLLQDFVIDQVRELLGNTARHIGAHTSLVVLGLDSLGAVQLQQRLQNALHIKIKPGVIWVNPSAAALADALLEAMKLPPTPHDHTPAHDDLTVEGR